METQEKLTLKELVGYLPYGLNYIDSVKGFKGIRELNINTIQWCLSQGVLLLRPLSDLTKEITHNGETFVPIEKLRKDYSGFYFESNPELLIKSKNTSMYISLNWTNEFQKILYEWHFAINIPEHLYIDINTLPNE